MSLAVLIPVAVLGAVLWLVLLLTRRAAPFTLATAASFYAHLMVIASLTMALAGAALGIKVLLGAWNRAFSYYTPSLPACAPGLPEGKCVTEPNPVDEMLRSDVVLAITLLVVGLAVLGLHYALIRLIAGRPGGAPAIVTTGSLVAFTVLYGITGLVAAAAGLYGALNYAVWSGPAFQQPQPFGDSVGAAVVFIPAWIVAALRLVAATRHRTGPEPEPAAAAA